MQSECQTCNKKGKKYKYCQGCIAVKYCSRECQVNDWKNHKGNCKDHPALDYDKYRYFNKGFVLNDVKFTCSQFDLYKKYFPKSYKNSSFDFCVDDFKGKDFLVSDLDRIESYFNGVEERAKIYVELRSHAKKAWTSFIKNSNVLVEKKNTVLTYYTHPKGEIFEKYNISTISYIIFYTAEYKRVCAIFSSSKNILDDYRKDDFFLIKPSATIFGISEERVMKIKFSSLHLKSESFTCVTWEGEITDEYIEFFKKD